MTKIPKAALILGLIGLIPFIGLAGVRAFNSDVLVRLTVTPVLMSYAAVILSFMAGCIWAFAAQGGRGNDWVLMSVAVLPALWAFFLLAAKPFLGFFTGPYLLSLMALAFAILLLVDRYCVRCALAPQWWMRLRLLLTAIVVPCLLVAEHA